MFPRINLSELRPGRFEIASRPNFYPTVRQCIQQNIQKKKTPHKQEERAEEGENNNHFTKET
jgi:hypothetical protein